MKRFVCITLAIILTIIFTVIVTGTSKDYSIECQGETFNFSNKEELSRRAAEQAERQDNAHAMANYARTLGLGDNHPTVLTAKEIWQDAEIRKTDYQNAYNHLNAEYTIYESERKRQEAEKARLQAIEDAKWSEKEAEFPHATFIWRYLKDLGYNDYVCAGIMGNLMAEVGGQTLNIQYWLHGNGYYGMCQWNKAYSSIWGADLATQCNFLRDTIQYELNTFGGNYQKGFNYNSFINLTNARNAALAFAKCYERCGSSTYGIRQNNAEKAYNYFVG